MVMVAVIWLLALLGGLVTAMSLYATDTLSVIAVSGDRPRADAAIEAGLAQAVARLLATKDDAPPGAGTVTAGDATVRFSWVGETARIDVNRAPAELLAGLFTRLGAPADAAAGYAGLIVALRGEPAVARQADGTARPPGYDPNEETKAGIMALLESGRPKPGEADRHTPILDTLQLGSVPGLPADLMVRAGPYLTTFSGVPEIDPRWAAPLVIEALPGMTRERVRTVLDLRTRPGVDPAALDDALGTAKPQTTTKPVPTTRVTIRAVLADGFTAAAEIVIIHFPNDRTPYRVLSWDDEADLRHAPL